MAFISQQKIRTFQDNFPQFFSTFKNIFSVMDLCCSPQKNKAMMEMQRLHMHSGRIYAVRTQRKRYACS